MRSLLVIAVLLVLLAVSAFAQIKSKTAATPDNSQDNVTRNGGIITGKTYSNTRYGFEIVMPAAWYFAGRDFESLVKKDGIDLSIKAPNTLTPTGRTTVNRSVKDVDLLFTAFRAEAGSKNSAILRVAVEDLKLNPAIQDAIDYFDAVRETYKVLPLPADFQYSETQAEKLGAMEFGYLDTSAKEGKKRMYATVRKGFAIIFTLSYSADEDLVALQRVLEEGNFDLK